jgi:5-hydroxyisourate hydrolase-like protein (transthyretin family)
MKLLRLVLCSLLIAAPASSKCSMVEVVSPEPSTQKVKIITFHNGVPARNVRIEVFATGEQLLRTHATNNQGIVRLLLSPPGRYRISATAADGVHTDLILDVAKGMNESVFPLDLDLRRSLTPTLQNMIAAAESGVSAKISRFRGVVVDPAGAVVQHTKITVYKKGSGGKKVVSTMVSDASGQFSKKLRAGSYTAAFVISGFKTFIVAFQIAPGAEGAGLRVPLPLAPVT